MKFRNLAVAIAALLSAAAAQADSPNCSIYRQVSCSQQRCKGELNVCSGKTSTVNFTCTGNRPVRRVELDSRKFYPKGEATSVDHKVYAVESKKATYATKWELGCSKFTLPQAQPAAAN